MELMSTRWFIISLSCGGDTFPDNSGTIPCWMALGRLIAVINTVHHRENSKVLASDLVLGYMYFFLHDTCLQGFSQPPWLLLLHPLPHHCKIYARQHQFCDFLLWRHTAMEHVSYRKPRPLFTTSTISGKVAVSVLSIRNIHQSHKDMSKQWKENLLRVSQAANISSHKYENIKKV